MRQLLNTLFVKEMLIYRHPAYKSARSGKSAVLPSLTNQALTCLIWQAIHGLHRSAELINVSLKHQANCCNWRRTGL